LNRPVTGFDRNRLIPKVVAKWEGELDLERARQVFAAEAEAFSEEPEAVANGEEGFAL